MRLHKEVSKQSLRNATSTNKSLAIPPGLTIDDITQDANEKDQRDTSRELAFVQRAATHRFKLQEPVSALPRSDATSLLATDLIM